jgi:hypothetical protein
MQQPSLLPSLLLLSSSSGLSCVLAEIDRTFLLKGMVTSKVLVGPSLANVLGFFGLVLPFPPFLDPLASSTPFSQLLQ